MRKNNCIPDIIKSEKKRQKHNIELIASENFVSKGVLAAAGSVLTNKYAEGYPEIDSIEEFQDEFPCYAHTGNVGRYYGGCYAVDRAELYTRYMFQRAFRTDYHVNVQPHSGSSANMAAYMAVLKPGDMILSMRLDQGSHLSHGSPVNFSGNLYHIEYYSTDANGEIDYEDVERKALECHPKLILAGASAYSRIIWFDKFRTIADKVGAFLMADIAHIAGLVVAGCHPSPFGMADIVTTTTHKTFRGPRGGVIFCKPELAKKIDSAVFPGVQGGPLMHIIAAKGVAAEEACTEEYHEYIRQVVRNTKAMCGEFKRLGYRIVTGGTDNHLFLIDFSETHPHLTGRQIQEALDAHGITVNKNCVLGEKRSPKETSGVRIGLAAMTTKGWREEDCIRCADRIDEIISSLG